MNKILRYTGKDLQNIELEGWLNRKPAKLRPIASKWIKAIHHCGPDVQGIFHDNYPMGCVDYAPFAYVNVYSTHVNVGFFYGATLPDPSGILEGTGKLGRHIKLRPDQVYEEQAVRQLIQLAYQDILQRTIWE